MKNVTVLNSNERKAIKGGSAPVIDNQDIFLKSIVTDEERRKSSALLWLI